MAPQARVLLAALCWSTAVALPSAAAEPSGDEQILRAAGVASEGQALLDFFRKQIVTESVRQRSVELIRQLGADSFSVREKASADLIALGPVTMALLRQAIRATPDIEVRRRARACVEQIQTDCPAPVAAAAARMLALRKPTGAAEVLLCFLPGPYDASIVEEIQTTLLAVARADGSLDPSLIASLTATIPARRTAAALTLCRIGAVEHRPAVRKLLRDGDLGVRLSVAQALAVAGDREAVPVLIELLAQVSVEQAGRAEELLYRLAGPQAPQVPLGGDPAAQVRCRDAWRGWWRQHGAAVDLAVLKDAERLLGYTLLVLLNDHRVIEWDRDGKPRWHIDRLASPLDAEVLSGQRVLIAEHGTRRVTERNLKGEVLWEKKLSIAPIHAQRLPGGTTFIATRKMLLEVDRGGGEVVRYRSAAEIITARRFRDGRIGCIENNGSYFELDSGGKERRRFAVGAGVYTTNALTLLRNDHVIIVSYGGGTVQEYDRAGKVVWQIKLGRPLCALRMASGNTLVSSQDMVVIEYDRAGKEIHRREARGHPCQIRLR